MITQVKKENLLSFYKNGLDEFHFPENPNGVCFQPLNE